VIVHSLSKSSICPDCCCIRFLRHMSSPLLSAYTNLIGVEVLYSLVLVIALAVMINLSMPNSLRQVLQNGSGYFMIKPEVPLSATKADTSHRSQSRELWKKSGIGIRQPVRDLSTNLGFTALKVAAVLVLLYLSTLSRLTTNRVPSSMLLPIPRVRNLTC
jgi:hypothetical protein